MNREFLKGLGIEDEQIEKIMAEHGKTVNKTKDDLTAAQAEVDSLKTQIADRDAQLETLSEKAKGNEALLAQIEQIKADNEAKLAEIKAEALDAKKAALLAKAGYTDEQIEVLRGTVVGETDDELTDAIEKLVEVIAPKSEYVDPSAPNGGGQRKPEPKDGTEVGRDLFSRLKEKGKIK